MGTKLHMKTVTSTQGSTTKDIRILLNVRISEYFFDRLNNVLQVKWYLQS